MAEAPPPPSSPERNLPLPPPPQAPSANQQQQYWCYQCERRVLVNMEEGGVVCRECNNGFVESISAAPAATIDSADVVDDPEFGSQFLQVLRLIAQASRERDGDGEGRDDDDDEVPPPPPDRGTDEDFLRIELDGWHNDDEDDYEEDEDEDDEGVEIEEHEEEFEDGEQMEDGDESETEHDGVEENNDENNGGGVVLGGEEEGEEAVRRRRSDVLRLRIRDLASRATSGRNRFLDWAEILMGLENNSIELRVELPETDGYFANPEDYVDAAGYEALLQNLAESDQTGRRGAPAASKSAIAELPTVVIAEGEAEACAICKDGVNVGDEVKQLPCGHGYHEDCIVPWLGSRNSCPVCRYELPTDDPEYEEERKKALGPTAAAAAAGASGSGVL